MVSAEIYNALWYLAVETIVVTCLITVWASGCCCFHRCSVNPKQEGKLEDDAIYLSREVYDYLTMRKKQAPNKVVVGRLPEKATTQNLMTTEMVTEVTKHCDDGQNWITEPHISYESKDF